MGIVLEGAERFVEKSLDDLYANLAWIRIKRNPPKGVPYREIAHRSGMTERNVIAIIKERKSPTPRSVALLAYALQVPYSDLVMDHASFIKKYVKAGPLRDVVVAESATQSVMGPYRSKAS